MATVIENIYSSATFNIWNSCLNNDIRFYHFEQIKNIFLYTSTKRLIIITMILNIGSKL